MSTNGSILVTNQKGTFPGYGEVWFQPNAITNIVLQATVEYKGYLVEYKTGHHYTVSCKNSKVHFDQIPEGLHVLDLASIQQAGIV